MVSLSVDFIMIANGVREFPLFSFDETFSDKIFKGFIARTLCKEVRVGFASNLFWVKYLTWALRLSCYKLLYHWSGNTLDEATTTIENKPKGSYPPKCLRLTVCLFFRASFTLCFKPMTKSCVNSDARKVVFFRFLASGSLIILTSIFVSIATRGRNKKPDGF